MHVCIQFYELPDYNRKEQDKIEAALLSKTEHPVHELPDQGVIGSES